ncbi:DUF6468 domain-containing protein [Bradyrhizobium sp. LHD-71]|uniref:DUF6468 domain-containing protein n=1 Tax=Bradyrhizobium sp. LHD-71 TaxID=3072141 RepID=UPI00280E5928|nr:DUF6468 domain-containing protein [Bradyrhizobium sp. LHD-71]MDQ8732620.1 DUF6468 domain-containing protein [Bradyrhizobium sp. LHD-71]
MNPTFGLVIESLVAALLLLTICYCILLNKRLKLLRADEQSLKATIGELITATEIAERAIAGLKLTVRECNDNLGGQLATASDMCDRLGKHVQTGETVLHRLSRIAIAARAQPETTEPRSKSAKAIVAAAEAFTERTRANGLAA